MEYNFPDITKMKDPTRQNKTSEKMAEAKDRAAGPVREGFDLPSTGKMLSRPGLHLEEKIEQEKTRLHRLIREQNLLSFSVTKKEAKLKLLQETLRDKDFKPPGYNDEDSYNQRKQQLEINKDKMSIKIIAAEDIYMAYQQIHEHLLQEVREMCKAHDHKVDAVSIGQAEVERASKQSQAAAAALESSQGWMVDMDDEFLRKKREMDFELYQLNEDERNPERTLKHLSATSQSRQKEREIDGDQGKEEATDHQCCDVSGASQSERKLVEDMEALREALGDSDVQELGHKLVSQWATQEQLLAKLTRYQDQIRQGAEAFAELDLQHTKLKFGAGPSAARLDELRAEVKAEWEEKALRVQRLQAELKQSQDLLDRAKQGVNNLYFRMSCVSVEGVPSASRTDCMDQLEDIRARLPILLQRASEQEADGGLHQETLYTLHEQLNTRESRNAKTQSAPIVPPHLSDGEEGSAPSREEIKRCSSRLIEAGQKKSSRAKWKQ
ncbi:uncharacterized protein LOC119224415 [Pungitius pungitius]|uniref:uncharacterized protein LOC119224415 n=1 Tax=Pungitius pungitius TaxID=134920 RepID=UPI002E0EE3C4